MALQTEVQAKQAEMEALGQYLLLPDAEWAELKALLTKPLAERTEAELGRIGALAQQMNTIQGEWRQLTAKQPSTMTPEEKTNFDAINARGSVRSAEMGQMETSYNAIFKERAQTIFTNARTQILAAVAQVAQQQQMSIVVERGAVLYGGTDITDPVMKFINDAYAIEKAAPPAGATTAPAPTDGGAGGGQG
jgi:Skp family chaperone for outer membrane proteins